MNDWLDTALDELPGEAAPSDFADQVHVALAAEGQSILRGFGFRRLGQVAAAIFLLVGGYWLGQGQSWQATRDVSQAELTAMELSGIAALYENREILESWELLENSSLSASSFDGAAATWMLEAFPLKEEGSQ